MASPAPVLLLAVVAALIQPGLSQVKRAPFFTQNLQAELQTRGVPENTPLGTSLGRVQCDDTDGNVALIRYRVDSQTVRMNDTTGEVTMNRLLDRETTPENQDERAKILRVNFYCTDADGLQASVALDITVLDVNDNAPQFTNRPYATSVPENTPVGTTIMNDILLRDDDLAANARVIVTCQAVLQNQTQTQDSCEYFRVTSTQTGLGRYTVTVVLIRALDFEFRRDFSIPLFARDEGTPSLNSTESVLVAVTDQQDTPPLFLNTPITVYVAEGSPVGSSLSTSLSAQDGDRGSPRPLNISILEDRDNLFQMGPSVRRVDLVGSEYYSAPIFINAPIDREKYIGTYTFTAKVTELDNGQPTAATATAVVTVSVSDINDNVPTFSNTAYTVSVAESDNQLATNNLQIPDLNIQVTDLDDASNAVYFVRIRSQTFPAFRVFPVNITGNAILNLLVNNVTYLDYDTPAYRQQIVVLEAVENTSTSSTTVTINLQDVNDNVPIFTSTANVSISESTPVGTSVTRITATDRDSGENGRVTYSLPGTNSDIFRIDPNTGVVTLAQALNYENVKDYTLLFEASDNGNPRRVDRKTVYITVTDVNDVPPAFLQSYVTYAFESSLNLTPSVRVQALDPEQTTGLTYRIQGDNPQNSFSLNPTTGDLTLVRQLDYDNTPNRAGQFLLTIIAVDSGSPPLTGTTTVTINVQDENNKSPVFLVGNIYTNISEITQPGTTVATVSATDADLGTNGEVRYQIYTGSVDHFTIDAISGRITVSTNARFDYDAIKRYVMTVYAIDRGSPPQTGTATVIVDLLDANNKAPEFSQAIYTRSIRESEPIGTSVLQLQATDSDTTSLLQYQIDTNSIIARNSGGGVITSLSPFNYLTAFTINNGTGLISTNSLLKREYAAKISFTVVVRDLRGALGIQTATASVLITVLGTNVSTIVFNPPWTELQPEYRLTMTESRTGSFFITTVGARDPTCGYCLLNNYVEVPDSDPMGYFSVEQQTGRVRVDQAVDYERLPVKTLSVEVDAIASDGRSARTTIYVEVADDNDNNPVFEQTQYEFSVMESAQFPTIVGYVSATDADSGSFGLVSFSLSGQNSTDFLIDPQGYQNNRGMIVIGRGKQLDYETKRVYNLLVLATDNPLGGTSKLQLQTSVPLTINVLDVNDNAPLFSEDSNYVFYAVESYNAGARVGAVLATDKDTGTNGEITYSISADTASDTYSLFQVDPRSGIITTRMSLRGMSVNSPYYLIVRAEDQGAPQLMSTKQVEVQVQSGQLDDGTPWWSTPSVGDIFEIPEHSPLNTTVTTVVAKARTPNAGVTYSWLPSADAADTSKFGIHPVTGRVYVTGDLDREVKEVYSLIVSARDTVNTTLESVRRVTIRLLDIEDNVPSFYACPYKRLPIPVEVQLMEGVAEGTFVYKVEACDPDGEPNNYIIYSAEKVNSFCRTQMEGDYFNVLSDGTITTNKTMDREVKAEFWVCIRANQSSTRVAVGRRKRQVDVRTLDQTGYIAYVRVTLIDLNDNGPTLANKTQIGILPITAPVSTSVVTVSAHDPDAAPNNRVRYVRESTFYHRPEGSPISISSAFVVNSDTGEVTTNLQSYSGYYPGFFEVTIRAEDYYDSTKNDTMVLRIYMYSPSQSFRLVLNEPPQSGQERASAIINDLNSVDTQHRFQLEAVAAHRLGDDGGVDTGRTDVCFVYIVSGGTSVQSLSSTGDIVTSDRFRSIITKYGSPSTGPCYASQTSRSAVSWQALWWVLVAIGIFIFFCCLVLIIFICIRYDNYKYNMTKGRPYMVQS